MGGHSVDMAGHTRETSKRSRMENAGDMDGQGKQDGTQARGPSAVPDRERVGASGRGLATLSIAMW